jgi:hypothetical protein
MFNNCVCVSISEIVFKGMSCGMVLGVLFKKKKKKKEGKNLRAYGHCHINPVV